MNKEQQIAAILKQYWGYDQFRTSQQEIILSILNGQDTLALLPTGGGKSICFQVPALAMDGICIVISPLIALMKDQVYHLKERGILAAAIFSGMHAHEVDRILDNCIYGEIKFLYVSPERLESPLFRERLQKMKVSLWAVDEAHCIAQWGYDFRPPYLKIAEIRTFFPKVPVLALTATATAEVREDIQEKLAFKNGAVYVNSFARSNLAYVVQEEEEKMEKLIHILKRVPGCGIVYVRNRKLTRETAEWLNNHGISADFYHAGLTIADRSKKQEAWIKNKVRIMVATNAFGMGIDKPDVRVVVHIDLADSLEAYYQEAGRGGRDGNKAYAIVLYNQEDVEAAQFRLKYFNPTPTQIVQVYEALAHYFQIPLGSGVGESFDFNISDFCQKFNQDPPVVLRAIQILEQHDYLTPSEAVFLPSRLRFLVDKSALYTFEIENKRSEPLIKCLLRNYPLFNGDFVEIQESVIAAQLQITLPALIQLLLQLQQFNIVEFLPKKNAPQLAFNQGRRATSSIAINAALLNEQMAKYQYRLNAVEQYVTSKTKCRSRLLLAYFNEPISSNCGQCDYCLSLKKNALESAQFDLVISAIQTQFNDQSFTIAQLQHGLPSLTLDRINPVIQWLLQENLLKKNEQGYYKPPNFNY